MATRYENLYQLEKSLLNAWPISKWENERILVGVSGGADSVALLRAMARAAPCEKLIHAAHLNHRLRLPDADQDEAFVASLCRQLGITCHISRAEADEIAKHSARQGTESAARKVRYRFLVETANAIGARYAAVAHTADDQVETVIHNIIRGTGLAGVAGIRPFRRLHEAVTLVRPLLSVTRDEIIAYLGQLSQDYRTDRSNLDIQFTRNYIRQKLLPLIQSDLNPNVRLAITRLSQLCGEAQQVVEEKVSDYYGRLVQIQPNRAVVNLSQLSHETHYVYREMFLRVWRDNQWPLMEMTFEHWHRLIDFAQSGACSNLDLPNHLAVSRNGELLVITRRLADSES